MILPEDPIVFKKLPIPSVLFEMPRRERLMLSMIACRKEIQAGQLHCYLNEAIGVLKDSDEATVNSFCLELLDRGGFVQFENQWLKLDVEEDEKEEG